MTITLQHVEDLLTGNNTFTEKEETDFNRKNSNNTYGQ